MRVLFLYLDTNSSVGPRIAPGVAFLSGYLKRNNIETDLCYINSSADEEYCINTLQNLKTDIIAVSSVTSSFPRAKKLIKRIKEEFPEVFTICGGAHVSLCPEEISLTEGLDAICLGYGEEALLELVQSIEKGKIDYGIKNLYFNANGKIIKNELRVFCDKLDAYFPEDRAIFYKEFDRKGLEDTESQEFIFCRGCPFDCTYCSNHILKTLGKGKYINYPEVETCIDDIKQAMKVRKIKRISFHDDIFTLNKPWFKRFTEQYAKEIGLPFMCNARIGNIDEEDIITLKNANCKRIIFGIESGNYYIRNTVLNKKIGSNSDIIKVYKLVQKHGIATLSQNLVGVPEENFERFYDTVKINAAIMPNSATISVYYPYPGTDLYKKAKNDGLFKNGSNISNQDFVEREESLLELPDFSKQSIEYCAKHFKQMIFGEYVLTRIPLNKYIRKVIYSNHLFQRVFFFSIEAVDKIRGLIH
jgi:radical SAM superfamily enzyme YgiQ (UPF0313 family)